LGGLDELFVAGQTPDGRVLGDGHSIGLNERIPQRGSLKRRT
jgi:hypothetical protein